MTFILTSLFRKRPLASICHFGSVAFVSNLYPHPSASAAGVRTSFMLDRFTDDPSIGRVHFLTGAAPNDAIEKRYPDVTFHQMPPNDTPAMKALLNDIGTDLSMVIFDRFYAEEAYSFHFREHCPHALRVLDMQDMHSLRLGREEVVLRKRDEDVEVQDPFGRLEESIQYEPRAYDEKLLRELASLHRSDLAMVCSPREIVLLEKLGLARQKLVPASFWVEPMGSVQRTTFESRKNFVFLGGFKHPPNVDAVKVLAESIWPKIHQLLPESSLHIYGAFCPPQLAKNFKHIPNLQIHGFASSLEDILTEHRVMLAPLRFGAGIKGKIVDAWNFGLPVVSTGIGMEGMTNSSGLWGGRIANAVDDYVAAAVDLYSNQPEWAQTSRRGIELNLELFPLSQWDHVVKKLKYSIQHRDELRNRDYHGAILWHHTARSTEYFSRWIECKNKNANNTAL